MRLPAETVIEILHKRVFPFVAGGELVRMDFNMALSYDAIEGTAEDPPAAEGE